MANLLQLLGLASAPAIGGTSAQQIRPIQLIDPDTGLPVSGPTTNGVIPPAAPGASQASTPVNLLEGTPYGQPNVLQAIGGSLDAPQPAPVPQAPQAQPAAPTEAPRQRLSLLDTVGRISDVLARVGGAEALYQPTLDAREDRANALADRQRGIDLDALRRQIVEQQIAAGNDEATGRGNAMLGAAVRGLQAIKARGGDISAAWPILARQVGLPEDRASALGQIFAQNPNAVDAIAAMTGQEREFGVQPFYAQGPDGQLRAYQLGRDGSIQPIQLGEGETPIDPLRFVDTGGSQVGVGTRSGQVRRILPNSVSPDAAAGNASRERIASAGNASRERVAATRSANGQNGNSRAQARAAQIPAILNAINTLEQSIAPLEQHGWSGALGGWVPSILDRESDVFETNLGLVRQLIRGLTRVEGEGSISDYETRLQQATLPSRTQTPEGRRQAIANIRALIRNLQRGYAAMTATGPRAAPRGGGGQRIVPRAAPRGASTAPQGRGNAAAIAEARRRGLIP